jgi:hypothetical protein
MTHFAYFEFKRGVRYGQPLPLGHQWVCSASLESWPDVLKLWHQLQLPSIYLCERCAVDLGFEW